MLLALAYRIDYLIVPEGKVADMSWKKLLKFILEKMKGR